MKLEPKSKDFKKRLEAVQAKRSKGENVGVCAHKECMELSVISPQLGVGHAGLMCMQLRLL